MALLVGMAAGVLASIALVLLVRLGWIRPVTGRIRDLVHRTVGRIRCKLDDHLERRFRAGGIEYTLCLRHTCPTRGRFLSRIPVWTPPPRFIWSDDGRWIANPDHPETHGIFRTDRAPEGTTR